MSPSSHQILVGALCVYSEEEGEMHSEITGIYEHSKTMYFVGASNRKNVAMA